MPRSLAPTVLVTSFTLVSLSTVVVATRFYCRYFLVRSVKLFDYLMLFALFLTWGIATINYYQVKYGTGVRFEDQAALGLGPDALTGTLKSWYTYQLVYLVDLCAVKFSILTFYLLIAAQRSFRIAVYTVMGVVAAFTISMVFVNAFECPNPSDAWSPEILLQAEGSCNDLHPIYYGQAAFNILSDIVILILPMRALYTLQMRRNKRIALIAIFSAGSFAVIASIVRIYALTIWSADGADVPYAGANILIWSQIEINTAIISASIPSLKPLFKRTFEGLTTGRSTRRQSLYYGNRSYRNRTPTHKKPADVTIGSVPSVSRGAQSPAMELRGFRNDGGSNGAGIAAERTRGETSWYSDEERILPNNGSEPQEYNARQELGNVNDNGPGPRGSSLHIMRSVTIETSVGQDHANGARSPNNSRLATHGSFHYPGRQKNLGEHGAYTQV